MRDGFEEVFWRFKAAILFDSLAVLGGEKTGHLSVLQGIPVPANYDTYRGVVLKGAIGPYYIDDPAPGKCRRLELGELDGKSGYKASCLRPSVLYPHLGLFSATRWRRLRGSEGWGGFYGGIYRAAFLSLPEIVPEGWFVSYSRVGGPLETAVAAASFSNLVVGNYLSRGEGVRIKGFIVNVSLGSVQKFISKSRVSRDLYASSLISSLLLWGVVRGLVEKLGPDILVMPSPIHNRLVELSLISNLSRSELGLKLLKAVYAAGYGRRMFGFKNGRLHVTVGPTVSSPSTALLMLPGPEVLGSILGGNWDREELFRYFEERYRNAWKDAVEAAKCALGGGEIAGLLDAIVESPPQPLRVRLLEVDAEVDENTASILSYVSPRKGVEGVKSLGDMVERLLKAIQGCGKYGECDIGDVEVYENILSRVASAWPPYRGLTRETLHAFMEGAGEERKCSVCGLLPAVITDGVPHVRDLRREGVIRSGERLCPYCLMRRVVGGVRGISLLYASILGLDSVKVDAEGAEVPTTSDVAAYGFRLILNCSLGLGNSGFVKALNDYYEELRSVYGEGIESFPSVKGYVNRVFPSLRNVREEWLSTLVHRSAEEVFYNSLSEKLLKNILGREAGRLYEKAREVAEKAKEEASRLSLEDLVGRSIFNTYYGLLRSDVDGGGRFRRGYLPGGESYKLSLVVLTHYSTLMNRLSERYIELLPRYGAWPIFSSGDDLLAFVPVERALEAALAVRDEMRRNRELRHFSRSTALVFAHYRHPMYLVVRGVTELLEERAKKFRIAVKEGRDIFVKDALGVGLIPRGGDMDSVVVPQSLPVKDHTAEPNRALNALNMVYRELMASSASSRGLFNTSLLYDYFGKFYRFLNCGGNCGRYRETIGEGLRVLFRRNIAYNLRGIGEALRGITEEITAGIVDGAYIEGEDESLDLVKEYFGLLRIMFIASRGGV